MSKPHLFITGANRGIGLEMVKQFAQSNWKISACYRNPATATELTALAQENTDIKLYALDVTDYQAVTNLADELKGISFDLLINNAGIYGPKGSSLDNLDIEAWRQVFETNTIAPLKLIQAFTPHVAASEGKRIAVLSSKMGSISDNQSGSAYIYRSSKTALNQVIKSLSIDLSPQGIQVIALHPGWVRTEMGGPNGLIDTTESVTGLKSVMTSEIKTGHFYNYDGSEIAW
ncbi:short-chain dehydrogenase [Marinomonas sp. SBI22]|uniref:SDR family oxidoreductase n=1 Tax=unclassified Marinomonas TaxID=196814 RepID=UPI0007AF3262|nr:MULTISPECIES: SDR family oxidoreductase [unclassified Marinomonas]KZM44382.1 short-chain dehydrogenase [Marinomonas sp. SBI22]KZM45540.1 short-chain dehydrogenase [Marinomonas sp. SBI8L]